MPRPLGVSSVNIDHTIWKKHIGHYGGMYVKVPAEHWEEFKRAFPPNVFPRKIKRYNVADVLTGYAEAEFNRAYPRSNGVCYEVYFANASKGEEILDQVSDKRTE